MIRLSLFEDKPFGVNTGAFYHFRWWYCLDLVNEEGVKVVTTAQGIQVGIWLVFTKRAYGHSVKQVPFRQEDGKLAQMLSLLREWKPEVILVNWQRWHLSSSCRSSKYSCYCSWRYFDTHGAAAGFDTRAEAVQLGTRFVALLWIKRSSKIIKIWFLKARDIDNNSCGISILAMQSVLKNKLTRDLKAEKKPSNWV